MRIHPFHHTHILHFHHTGMLLLLTTLTLKKVVDLDLLGNSVM
jgi:hypothetical protein